MINALMVAAMIQIQGPGGQVIWLNPDSVTSVREPRGVQQGHWPADIRCLLMIVDGKFLATVESCDSVRRKLEADR